MKVECGEKFNWLGYEHIAVGPTFRGTNVSILPDITNPNLHEAPIGQGPIGESKRGIWRENIIANKQHMKHGIKGLWGTKKGKSAIIAGSGASLQREFLSRFSSKEWDVIACNDAYRLLDGNAEYASFLDAIALPKWYGKIRAKTKALLSCFCNQELPKVHWTRTYWYGTCPLMLDVPENTEIGEKFGWIQMAMNVTLAMLHFAYQAGYEKIVLVGCDFAYTDGKKHCMENLFYDPQEPYSLQQQIGGGLVLTNEVLAMQSRMHEAAAWFIGRKDIPVINATEGGIMTGMTCMTLREALS